MSRELTLQEKTAIRKLVTKWCANYDKDYGLSLIHISGWDVWGNEVEPTIPDFGTSGPKLEVTD